MLTIDSKTTRFLARMGARGVLGQAVYDLAKDGVDFYAITADLAHASGFDRLMAEFPEKFINVGIAEQNLIGVAAGLAKTGIPVIATTWAMFASVRSMDQVRNYLGFMDANVKLIGMDSGFIQSKFSYSHTNPPDIAIMRSVPGITILSPSDGVETYRAIYEAVKTKGPVYIRLTGDTVMNIVNKDPNYNFQIGKSVVLMEGKDVAIISTGNITKNVLDAANILETHNIDACVVNMPTIEPLDKDILNKLSDYKLLVTVEEHLINGGFGSAIAQYYCDKDIRPKHIIMGVDNLYTKSGTTKYLEAIYGLSPEHIAQKILNLFKE